MQELIDYISDFYKNIKIIGHKELHLSSYVKIIDLKKYINVTFFIIRLKNDSEKLKELFLLKKKLVKIDMIVNIDYVEKLILG